MKTNTLKSALHWSVRLSGLIKDAKQPLGSFVYRESIKNVPQLMPHVSVTGIGRLGLPLMETTISSLLAASTKAKFGAQDEPNIRAFTKVQNIPWQIDAKDETIGGGNVWLTYFTETIRNHCFELGISYECFEALGIHANFAKMLIYEEGEKFEKHQVADTHDENTFGSLILQLPTSNGFVGGDVTLSHQGIATTVDVSNGSDSEFNMFAFYSNCDYEVHPITKGHRVCLVYHLVVTTSSGATLIPSHSVNIDTEHELRLICDHWRKQKPPFSTKIGYKLENEFTKDTISVEALTGSDKIAFWTFRNAKNSLGIPLFEVSLLMIEYYSDSKGSTSCGPVKVFGNDVDGIFGEISMDDSTSSRKEWDMRCYSQNGWWVRPGEHNPRISTVDDIDIAPNFNDDEEDMFVNRCMVISPCHGIFKADSYEGSSLYSETWYYAAAIIISPNIK